MNIIKNPSTTLGSQGISNTFINENWWSVLLI